MYVRFLLCTAGSGEVSAGSHFHLFGGTPRSLDRCAHPQQTKAVDPVIGVVLMRVAMRCATRLFDESEYGGDAYVQCKTTAAVDVARNGSK